MATAAAVLVCVLELLGARVDLLPPIELVDVVPWDVSANAEAFTRQETNRIFLVTSTVVFREAQQAGNPARSREPFVKLASIVAHEAWHLQHGADEESAYNTQLMTLLRLGVPAGGGLWASVVRSKQTALKAQRASRARPDMIVAGRR